jgi:hypothetical protein
MILAMDACVPARVGRPQGVTLLFYGPDARGEGRRLKRGVGLTLLAALLLGCSKGSAPTPAPAPLAQPDDLRAYLRVENQSWANFQMWVLRANGRQALGRSTANTTRVYPLPASYLDPKGARISFIADPVGRPAPGVTRELTIFPGDTVMITIPPS